MKNIKIIAIDLDDTLLREDLSISDYSVSVLQKAATQGYYITLASGRTDNAILPYVRRLDIAGTEQGRYIISQNGAVILDLHTRLPIYERFVNPDVLIEVYRAARKKGLFPEVYSESTIYVAEMNPWTERDMKLSGLKAEVIEDFENFLIKTHPKMIVPGEPEVIKILQDELAHLHGKTCEIFTSKPYFLEILPHESGKGEALLYLAEKLGFSREETMCFGDGWNDESMIRLAGESVAMKNAVDGIKKLAKHETEFTHNEDGVAHFIEKHLLF
ncbi:MAG TPA: Cof-type HAD-IIB family hydrolase [Treponemataceae bacterium]|nr:Cof-type HAD-IIB family hydrolase [Treponemataceae bacterium]